MCNNGCVICGGRGIVGWCPYFEKCEAKIDCTTSREMDMGLRSYILGIGEACLRDDGELMEAWKQQIIEKNRKIEEMQAHINCLKAELEEIQMNKLELPDEPIKVAGMLISATSTYTNLFGKEQDYKVYDKSELRQIAEHLLVYCNHAEVE